MPNRQQLRVFEVLAGDEKVEEGERKRWLSEQ
jgi:hypothetical protein